AGAVVNRRPGRDRGQALAEFALVAPLLVVLAGGLLQLGWLAWGAGVARTAAARGLRAAAVAEPAAARAGVARLVALQAAVAPGILPVAVVVIPWPPRRLALAVTVRVPRLVPWLT